MNRSVEIKAKTYTKMIEKANSKYGKHWELLSCQNELSEGIGGFFGWHIVKGQFLIHQTPSENPINAKYESFFNEFEKKGKHSVAVSSLEDQLKKEKGKEEIIPIPQTLLTPFKEKNNISQKNFEVEKQKIVALGKQSSEMKNIQSMLVEINQKLDAQKEGNFGNLLHPSIKNVKELLEKNEFSADYIEKLLERIHKELSIEQLDDYPFLLTKLTEWISDSIQLDLPIEKAPAGPKIVVLVGPTGVGKTTTVAKLVANLILNGEGQVPPKIVMFTVDTYRLGAEVQIQRYGEILNVPVKVIREAEDLKKQILLFQDMDYIVIDTIGKSPRDRELYLNLQEMLEVCREDGDFYLTLAASTKTSDLADQIRSFEIFNYRSIILTKLDETRRIGNIISVLSKNAKKLSYITTGQQVPQDIIFATKPTLLNVLEGFKYKLKNYPKMNENNESLKMEGV